MNLKRKTVFVVGADHLIRSMYRDRNYTLVDNIKDADIVQFVGGADVNPSLYGEIKLASTSISNQADERDLDAWEKSHGKFRAGICRGGQFLNVRSGGKMWQHIDGHATFKGHTMRDIIFAGAQENVIHVSSTHHQLMAPSDDGEIIGYASALAFNHKTAGSLKKTEQDAEVVWYNKTNSLCHQPHPEYKGFQDCTKHYFKLIEHFMN